MGELGLYAGNHPAPPCFHVCWLQPDGSWYHTELCAAPEVPEGTAANQTAWHRDPAHTAGAGAHLQPSSRGGGLRPGDLQGARCWGDAQGHSSTRSPTQPWQGAPCCSPAAGPAPGCLRKGFPFLPHPQRPGAILPSKAQVNNLTS